MIAAVVHVLAGEVTSALVGGPLITVVWLVRGHAYLALDAPEPPPPEPVKKPLTKKAPAAKAPAPKPPQGQPPKPAPAGQKAPPAPNKPPK